MPITFLYDICVCQQRDYSGNCFVFTALFSFVCLQRKNTFQEQKAVVVVFYGGGGRRFQLQRRLIDRKEADAYRILTSPSSRAKWTERAAGAACSLQRESQERRHLVEISAIQHANYGKHEIYWDRSGTEAEGPHSAQGGSLQQLNGSLLLVPPGLLQRRAPPPGGKTKVHHTLSL